MMENKNRLSAEKSPYLLQHKDNPVWWQPWEKDVFELAKKLDRPIFLSSGYSTCHWCHVMEHESFENQEVADILNQNFLCIKLDREERPDIDSIYMTAVQNLTGSGGWPMSVWLTPEGKPFFAGTYFRKEHFIQLLNRINDIWTTKRERVLEDSEKIFEWIKKENDWDGTKDQLEVTDKIFNTFIQLQNSRFESRFGGFSQAPKFPSSMALMALLRIRKYKVLDQPLVEQIDHWVTHTLNCMSLGGMYDLVGGGFCRYSVDPEWLVPHFEKMLYDNALMGLTYLEAHQLYPKENFKQVAQDILKYVLRDLRSPEGGFYCAEDADSENPENNGVKEEGYFYTFQSGELKALLSQEEYQLLENTCEISEQGNFEGRNILRFRDTHCWKLKESPEMKSALAKIEDYRNQRPKPHLDDKILTSWNGLMALTLAHAYRQTGLNEYLEASEKCLNFILDHLWKDGTLYRRYREGHVKEQAMSEDYANMISALLEVYFITDQNRYYEMALTFQSLMDKNYWDEKSGGYYQDDGNDPTLISRVKESYDGVTPTANSMALHNLIRLHQLTGDESYEIRAHQLLATFSTKIDQFPITLSHMVSGYSHMKMVPKEVILLGDSKSPDFQKAVELINSSHQPEWIKIIKDCDLGQEISFSAKALGNRKHTNGPFTLYICQHGQCQMPIHNLDELKAKLGIH